MEWLGQLAKEGILGLLLTISIVALYIRDKQYYEALKQRIKDNREWKDQLLKITKQNNEAYDNLSRLVEKIEDRLRK